MKTSEIENPAERARVEALIAEICDMSQTITAHQEIHGKPCYMTFDLSQDWRFTRRVRENWRIVRRLGFPRRKALAFVLKLELRKAGWDIG